MKRKWFKEYSRSESYDTHSIIFCPVENHVKYKVNTCENFGHSFKTTCKITIFSKCDYFPLVDISHKTQDTPQI